MNVLLLKAGYCGMELNGLQVLEGGCHEMTDLPVPKSRLLWDGVISIGWMLRDELPVAKGRVLSDGVAGGGRRLP